MVYSPRSKHLPDVPFKYLSQTFKTLRILFVNDLLVIRMTPPFLRELPRRIYSRITGRALSHHDCPYRAFLDPRWKPLCHSQMFSRGRATIVTTNTCRETPGGWNLRGNHRQRCARPVLGARAPDARRVQQ